MYLAVLESTCSRAGCVVQKISFAARCDEICRQVLTDRICSKCSKVPLMRSPPSAAVEVHFCVNCDPAPSTGSSANAASAHPSRSVATRMPSTPQDVHSISSTSNSSGLSRSSTPPTEVSHAPDSPPLVPVMDTAELMRRRHQSDTASAEIGKRMLRGWAMLADECPNADCYGIPLVRPPKTGTTIDPRKASRSDGRNPPLCADCD